MARKCIGLPFGGMIALCALLLLAPDTYGEGFVVRKQTFVISGTVGLADVTLNGFPVPPGTPPIKTDQNGAYSAVVEYGWHGTVQPVKPGYKFSPASKSYPNITDNLPNENYTAALVTYTISGSVEQPGVQMIGFPEEVVSDPSGRYTANIPWNWSGTVTPTKTAWQFEPASKPYKDITRDLKDDNYKASEQRIVISGTAGVEGVVLKGLPGDPVSQKDGTYRAEVKYGWGGTVTPTKEGHEFLPPTNVYTELTANQTNQDYTAKVFTYQISGTAGLAGVVMKGLPGEPMTDGNGFYSATVPHGWFGKVTPDKPGYEFTPKSTDIPRVTANKENVDFNGKIIYYTIVGNTGTPRVTLSGLPGDPVSDDRGQYTAQVEYGWIGSATPKKEGFIFNPTMKEYTGVTQNVTQNYTAQGITFKISGSVGIPQVVLRGAPGTGMVVSGAQGEYSFDVPFGWKGKITPQKAGFSFDPNFREYPETLFPQPGQDYVARIMQYSVAGRILDETGNGVAEVIVRADSVPEPVLTDGNGQFDLKVSYGWKGKLAFEKEGYTFNPSAKMIDAITTDVKSIAVAAKVRILTIIDRVTVGEGPGAEPIAEVTVTPNPAPPGTVPAITDTTGRYTIRVPYGWVGELKFKKKGFVFEPDTKQIPRMTADIDNISPKPAAPPSGPAPIQPIPTQSSPSQSVPAQPSMGQPAPGQPSVGQPAPIQPASGVTNDQKIAELQQQRNALETQIAADKKVGRPITPDVEQKLSEIKKELSTLMISPSRAATLPNPPGSPGPGPQPTVGEGPFEGPDLHYVLSELARRAGVTITWDATVKPDPVPIALDSLNGLPITTALQRVVDNVRAPYRYRAEEVSDRVYRVFRPLENMFPGVDLVTALQDLSAATDVTIIADPNVTGQVNISFKDVSLDQALEMLLAGKPYVFKKLPNYYLVADRGILGRVFPEVSETRRIRLNYTTAIRAKALLSPVFLPYVQAELPDPRDPNDMGNTLIITAVPSMVDRIVADLRQIDRFKRQVLLDARVVVMERGDLLNLGVEWSWPTIRAGIFTNTAADALTGLPGSGWPYAVSIGYTPDRTFTDSLMMALNLLQENSQADIIANPKVVAQDGRQAEMRVIQEEWFMMQGPQSQFYYTQAQLQKIESGTVLTITPYIGDNNDITLHMAVEVSDSIPKARGSDLPLVTRRTAKNAVTVKDGGTVAVGGLTENRSRSTDKRVPGLSELPLIGNLFKSKNNDKASREVAVFVTAHLVPEGTKVSNRVSLNEPIAVSPGEPAADEGATNYNEIRQRIAEALANQNR
jgi:hypothetical protein